MNLNEWTLNRAAGLLNEDFDLLGDGIPHGDREYDPEEVRKRLKQQSMLHEDIDSDNSFNEIFDTLTVCLHDSLFLECITINMKLQK